jgi:hypothetical protein
MISQKTHYQILCVDTDASDAEIKKAYKRLARAYHPDLNPNRPKSAEEKFKELQDAYSVLSDPISRQQYDRSINVSQTYPSRASQSEVSTSSVAVESETIAVFKVRFLDSLSPRRKVALALWGLCLLGSFLPTSYSVVITWNSYYWISLEQRLLWITVPLVMIFVGSWMSDGGSLDMSPGTILKEGFGRLMETLAWIYFARLVGLMVIGPLVLLFS